MAPNQLSRRLHAAALGAGVLLLLFFQLQQGRFVAARRVGFFLEGGPQGVVVTDVVPGGPAAAAGVKVGDVLLAVGGERVEEVPAYDRSARRFRPGEGVIFEVKRGGSRVVLTVKPGMPFSWGVWVMGALAALGYLVVALLAVAHPGGDQRRQLLAGFATAVALELAWPSFPLGPPLAAHSSLLLFYLLTGLELALELHLVALIPRPAPWILARPRRLQLIYGAGAGVAAVLSLLYLLEEVAGLGLPLGPWGTSSGALLDLVVLPAWALVEILLIVQQVRTAPTPLGRQQAALVLAGVTPWALYALGTAAVFWAGYQLPQWSSLVQSLALLGFPVAVFVAVFRYQFLDFELVVRRSLLYMGLTFSVLLVFYALLGLGSALLAEVVGGGLSVVVVSASTLILGLLFAPLRSFLQRLIDQQFFPERYAQRQLLVALAAELPGFGKVGAMGQHLVRRVEEIFGTASASLLLADPANRLLVAVASTRFDPEQDFDSSFLLSVEDPAVKAVAQGGMPMQGVELARASGSLAQRLASFSAELVVPVLGPLHLVGLLLVGPKREGESFTAEELELLSLLGHHVGAVLENARLFEAATVDALTGLFRREVVLQALEHELQRALRYGRPLSLGLADLDNFKLINDTYGHLAGDAVLKWAALTMRQSLRTTDLLGRYGGEEFLLVFPETDLRGAQVVAEKVRQKVAGGSLKLEDGTELHVTISLGLTELPLGGKPLSALALVERADRKLLEAKGAGRNQVRW